VSECSRPPHFLSAAGASLAKFEQASDLELVRQAREGDEEAFAEIVRRYSPRVLRFAGRFFRQPSLVEEAAQEVFLKAFTQLGDYKGHGSLEGWLTRITTTTCLNLLRSARRRPEATLADLTAGESAWMEDRLAARAAAHHRSHEDGLIAADLADRLLELLAPEDRLVLMLIDGEEASVKDVAEATGWSESKIKVRAMRARRRLREAIEHLLAGQPEKKRQEMR
jgi:RNA polymerase sigma-70 factor (ECF subfamily)